MRVDVLVVGGGPAGIAAAAKAAEGGATVMLADDGVAPGGQIWRPSVSGHAPNAAIQWRQRLKTSGALVRSSTTIVDIEQRDQGFTATWNSTITREHGQVDASRVIVATGARERFLPFPGWTLSGVFGIGGAQALLKGGLSVEGKRVVVAGSGPLLLPVAASLRQAGARVLRVAEQAPISKVVAFGASLWRNPKMLMDAARLRAAFWNARYTPGTWVVRAEGDAHVRSVTLTDGRQSRAFECDMLCAAFGLVPNLELARLLGCSTSNGFAVVDESQRTTVPRVLCAGEPTGIGGVDLSLVEGEIAGTAAVDAIVDPRLLARRAALRRYAQRLDDAFALRPELYALASNETIICRCEDVRLRELDRKWSSREAKLYTRAGMGPCQGRICGAALECMMGWVPDSVRPPLSPTPVAALAGEQSNECK